jgi:hypothetical protein
MKDSNPEKNIQKKQENQIELSQEQKKELSDICNGLKNYIDWKNNKITEINDVESYIEACKNYLFQTEIYKEIFMKGDLTLIIKISESIKSFGPKVKPEIYFILFKAVFNLYQSGLKQEYIIKYTDEIVDFIKELESKDKVVLSNFNVLFEVLIVLKVNLMSKKEEKNNKDKLDELLKESLNSEELRSNFEYLIPFFDLINIKIKTQQYIIINLIVDYIKTICNIKTDDYFILKIFRRLLQPLFKLQTDNILEISKSATDSYTKINKIKTNFDSYYKRDRVLMNEIFDIAIENSYPQNNKININTWNLLVIFFKGWLSKIENVFFIPHEISNSIKRTSTSAKKNLKVAKNIYDDTLGERNIHVIKKSLNNDIIIPFSLFQKTVCLIVKTYEINNLHISIESEITVLIIQILKILIKENYTYEELTKIILSGLENEKIQDKKEKLIPWSEFLFFFYEAENTKFIEFVIDYIKVMRLDDINYLKKMEKLLLDKTYDYTKNIKNSQNIFETIYEKFFDKVINSDLINDTQVYQIFTDIGTKLKESLVEKSNILTIFEIFGNVLTSISKKNNIIKDSKDNNNLSKNKKSDSNLINKLAFYEKIVYKLTEILLNEGISDFRHKYSNRKDKKTLFDKLYQIWAISPISVLILCISAEKFRLAYNIILNLKEIEFTDDIIGKLIIVVKYFAKDDYDYFWGKLLEPSDNIYFIKTFYGILMILPQGVAFDYLSDKLSNVNSLLLVENKIEEINSRKNSIINGKIRHFLNLQERKKKKVEK